MEEMRLSASDIITIMHIIQGYVDTEPHTEREGEYPAILQAVADGMRGGDGIVTDGKVTGYAHG